MKGSEHNIKTPCAVFSVRFLKHVFLGVIVLCFASILLLRVASWGSITIHVRKEKDEVLAMNHSEKLELVRSTLLLSNADNGKEESPPSVDSKDQNLTTALLPTTGVPTNTVEQLDDELMETYKFIYGGSKPETPSLDKKACPAIPPNLIGAIKTFEKSYTFPQLNSLNFRLSKGGSYSPPSCNASQKLAIVIPFRKRAVHLSILLFNLHPYLQKQQRDYTIFVVNQVEGSKFNRAMLMNIGFVEALRKDKYTCIIFHDVDLLPENDKNIYSCPEGNVRHMSAYINKFAYKLPYHDILGGIVAISSHQFVKVNGYSNQFFGWGGEDDDFSARCKRKGLSIVRYPQTVARYKMIQHQKDSGNEANPKRFEMLKHTGDRQKRDGLNSLKYTVKSIQLVPLYTRINVVVDQAAVMNSDPKPLPEFLQSV